MRLRCPLSSGAGAFPARSEKAPQGTGSLRSKLYCVIAYRFSGRCFGPRPARSAVPAFAPDGGRCRRRRGGTFTPSGVSSPKRGGRRGGVAGQAAPFWGPAAAPLRLDKTLTLIFLIFTIISVCYDNISSMIYHTSEYGLLDTLDIFFLSEYDFIRF